MTGDVASDAVAATGAQASPLDDPVLNGPYDPPTRFFEIGPKGPTGVILDGRRPSESFIPVPKPKKKAKRGSKPEAEQLALTFRPEEQAQKNQLINDLRAEVSHWRTTGYEGTTAITRKLLNHWADPHRDNRILFAQREAAETTIFLTEVAGSRSGYRRWRTAIAEANDEYNDGLPRTALKMATGSGKTVVMAMLIAWQTLNKVASPQDRRFVKRFLVVTPGITIRDRLRVLQPNDPNNYYAARGIVPAGLDGLLGKAQIIITNWHTFQLRDWKEIKGVARATRQILLAERSDDPFRETEDAMVSRVLRGWGVGTGGYDGASGKARIGEIMVFNDEAHHCYQDKPITLDDEYDGVEAPDKEAQERNADARIWFTGLQAIARRVGVKQVYDLSATPFYLSGSGYKEGFIFPWTVSDFSLMDAIESGIVKVPRIPVDDDAEAVGVTYLDLWERIGKHLPKRNRKGLDVTNWDPPEELDGALDSLYESYQRSFDHWQRELEALGEPPPVFIVVCPNTAVSKLMYDRIAGTDITNRDGTTRHLPGRLPLFRNADEYGQPLDRPRTILVDSAQLESGEGLSKEFKESAVGEIDAFKAQWRVRNPGGDPNALTDEDLLREVMNTVGKPDSLGSDVRCVVSVAMLTEGWDANTVTHILGIRAFRSQLLCEQVVGRGLRRRSYVTDDRGRFPAEYANVYGVPFQFLPSDRPVAEAKPPQPATVVHSVEGREAQRITFPRVVGYRFELPDAQLVLDEDLPEFVIGRGTIPSWTEAAPIAGTPELIAEDVERMRPRAVAYRLARRLVRREFALGPEIPRDPSSSNGYDDFPGEADSGGLDVAAARVAEDPANDDQRPWLFPELVRICNEWIDKAVRVETGFHLGYLAKYSVWEARAADAVYQAITSNPEDRRLRALPILRQFEPVGSTAGVSFSTRETAILTEVNDPRCEISHVVLDGPGGNTWEQLAMAFCEHDPRVAAYVKNDHLGFTIPYVFEGRTHDYIPDFLICLKPRDADAVVRTLIVEVSGGQKQKHSPGSTAMKAAVARDSWCAGVNNHGGFGRWGYVEITEPPRIREDLSAAIENLYEDRALIGPPDLLDLARADEHAARSSRVRSADLGAVGRSAADAAPNPARTTPITRKSDPVERTPYAAAQ